MNKYQAKISRAFGAEEAAGEVHMGSTHLVLRMTDQQGQTITCYRGLEALSKIKHYPQYVVSQATGQPITREHKLNPRTPSAIVGVSFAPTFGRGYEERFLLEFADAAEARDFCLYLSRLEYRDEEFEKNGAQETNEEDEIVG